MPYFFRTGITAVGMQRSQLTWGTSITCDLGSFKTFCLPGLGVQGKHLEEIFLSR